MGDRQWAMESVPVSMTRRNWWLLVGWISAHRPQGDWEPPFLTQACQLMDTAATQHESPNPSGTPLQQS